MRRHHVRTASRPGTCHVTCTCHRPTELQQKAENNQNVASKGGSVLTSNKSVILKTASLFYVFCPHSGDREFHEDPLLPRVSGGCWSQRAPSTIFHTDPKAFFFHHNANCKCMFQQLEQFERNTGGSRLIRNASNTLWQAPADSRNPSSIHTLVSLPVARHGYGERKNNLS